MKVLIAGLGSIGRRHLHNLISTGCRDIIVYRTHFGTLTEEDFPGVQIETDLARALNQHPDAVIIANPTARHLDIALPAASAGCSLLIEKPVSNRAEGIAQLTSIITEKNLKTLIGFQFRFHPGILKLHEWIRDGAIGRPLSARCEWGEYLPNWHPWEDYRRSYSARKDLGGGVVFTLSHPLDYLHWMLGDVEEINAVTGNLGDLKIEVEDFADIRLRFCNGVYANVHLDYFRQPTEHRLEIVGTEGVIEWRNATGAARLFRTKTENWETSLLPEGFTRNYLFLDEINHFIKVIAGKEESRCTLDDGIYNLQMCLAIHESAKRKEAIIFEGWGN